MAGCGALIRNARADEASVLARIEAMCWPAGLAADEATFRSRLHAFPEGQFAAELNGAVVGVATAQRITGAFLGAGPCTYARLTDHGRFRASHAPDGDIFQLISVSVSPEGRGARLGRALVDTEIDFARGIPGLKRIVGFTRPTGYHRHPDVPIEEYAARRREDGRRADAVLDFHLSGGARMVSIHAAYRPEDREALGYGILIEYPVRKAAAE